MIKQRKVHESYHIAVLLIYILVSHISQAVYTIQFCDEHPKLMCTPYCKLIIYLTIIKPIRSLTLSEQIGLCVIQPSGLL